MLTISKRVILVMIIELVNRKNALGYLGKSNLL